MKNKLIILKFIIIICLLIVLGSDTLYAQGLENDYSLTRVKKIEGVYIFIGSDPAQKYDYLGTVKAIMTWNGTPSEAFAKAVRKAKKRYPNLQGLIFADDDFDKADAIAFPGLEITGGSFRIGDKITYSSSGKVFYGEIISLDNASSKAKYKYFDQYGDIKLKERDYNNISKVEEIVYQQNIEKQLEENKNHQFNISEKVTWVDNEKPQYGEVISLDNHYHKATIKYVNIFNEYETKTINYLELTKYSESSYLNYLSKFKEEIKKYEFSVNEKVTWIDDKESLFGDVIKLDNSSHKATIKHLNIFNEYKTLDVYYLDLIKCSETDYAKYLDNFKEKIKNYKFNIGEKVSFTINKGFIEDDIKEYKGQILELDEVNHKASIKFNDETGKEKISKIDYLKIIKILK